MTGLFGDDLPELARPVSAPNLSTAVRQRRVEADDSRDDFPTPPWATRAVLRRLGISGGTCREPAANRGHMVRPLREVFDAVEASDVEDYGAGFAVRDYLAGGLPSVVDWTFTNPPFVLAEAFIERAIETSRRGVAVIVRSAFVEGGGRYERLFGPRPPTAVFQFVERVVMHGGVMREPGVRYWDPEKNNGEGQPRGGWRTPSTATAYCWIVWDRDRPTPPWGDASFGWIPPCRRELERPGDYPEAPEGLAILD